MFYYSAAVRLDYEILELFCFLTTEHGVSSIGVMLRRYKEFVMKHHEWNLFYAVVVDWSWVFIHLILLQWNKMTIETYFELKFNYCKELDGSILNGKILIKICYAHFMHIVLRAIDTKFPKLRINKKIIEIFLLLCLSRNLAEFDFIFHNFCIMLLSKNKDKFDSSLKIIVNLSQKQINDDVVKETYNFVNYCDKIDLDYESTTNYMYLKLSFYEKYNKILSVLEVELEQNEKVDEVSNERFFSKFVNHTLTLWIPNLPLWTAVNLDLINPKISRITNAYIEYMYM